MLDVLEFVVKSIVKSKDEVKIEEKQEGKTKVFNVYVAKTDMGAIIGKAGNTAMAIRTLIGSMNSHGRTIIKFNS